MAHEAVPHREPVVVVRFEGRAGSVVDPAQQVRVRGDREHVDRGRVAEIPTAPREDAVHVEVCAFADGVFQVQDRALLVVAVAVPHDLSVGEAAAQVARADAGRIDERAGIAVRRVAIPQRDRPGRPGPFSVLVQGDDKDGVATEADVLRVAERAARRPHGAAVVPAPRGDLVAPDDVRPDGHPSVADRAAPEDAALPAVAAFPGRHPRERPYLESVQIRPQHDVERAAHGAAAERAQGLAAQKLDALDGRERQDIQIAGGGGERPAVDHHEQRLPSREEVADGAGVQQLLQRLGAGTLDEVPLELGDDARGGREGAGVGHVRRQHGENGKRSQQGLHRDSSSDSVNANERHRARRIIIESVNPTAVQPRVHLPRIASPVWAISEAL